MAPAPALPVSYEWIRVRRLTPPGVPGVRVPRVVPPDNQPTYV